MLEPDSRGMLGSSRSIPSEVAIAVPGYGLHGFGLWAEWKLGSATGVLGVTAMIMALTCLLYSRFTRFHVRGGVVSVEASRGRTSPRSIAPRPRLPPPSAA